MEPTHETVKTTRTPMVLLRPLMFLALSQTGSAQDSYPRVEIFGGASYLPADRLDFPRDNSVGFQAGISGNLTRRFGIFVDFGGQFSRNASLGPNFPGAAADASVYEFMAGPRFTERTGRMNLFVHALVGGASGRTNLRGLADSKFAFGGGGGLDIHVSCRIAIRPLQLDYIGSFVDIVEDNIRAGAGIVIRLGRN